MCSIPSFVPRPSEQTVTLTKPQRDAALYAISEMLKNKDRLNTGMIDYLEQASFVLMQAFASN